MDIDTSEAIERLGERIDALEMSLRGQMAAFRSELHGEMGALRDELRGDMGALREELRGDMGALRDELRGDMGALRDELRGEFRDGLAENRRHTQVLFESLSDDIRILSEGFAHLASRIDRPRQ